MPVYHVADQIKRKKGQELIELEGLILKRPIQKGFYVVSGSREVASHVLDLLVDLLWVDSLTPAQGERATVGPLMWVDSGNVFDAYRVALKARERQLDPTRVLRSIQMARPFTAFQFHQMLKNIPHPAIGISPPHWRMPLVILSDLMGLFYDVEISEEEVRRAFRKFLVSLAVLQRRAVVVGLLLPRKVPAGRNHYLGQVLKSAHLVDRYRDVLEEGIRP